MSLPPGVPGEGGVCPHNVYEKYPQVFDERDDVAPIIAKIFRVVNKAELRLLDEEDMDPAAVTELITAKSLIDKRVAVKQEQERRRAQALRQAQLEQSAKSKIATMGQPVTTDVTPIVPKPDAKPLF